MLLFQAAFSAKAAVTLDSFTVGSENNQVRIEWETSNETNHWGFYIQRSTQKDSGYVRIGPFIESLVGEGEGDSYEYVDTNVMNGTTYWYQLEVVDLDNLSQIMGSPLSAVPGATATPGIGSTATTTLSAYPGPETSEPYATFTPNTYPGPAGTPVTASPTPAGSLATNPPTQSFPLQGTPNLGTSIPTQLEPGTGITTTAHLTATTTLVPLPTLTFIFPKPKEVALLVTATPEVASQGAAVWEQPQRLFPLALIVLIWVILGSWFYYSQRSLP